MIDRADRSIAAWLALLLFGIYLLAFSGKFYSQDSLLMFSVTESFAKRGEFNADQLWTLYKTRNELGPDGEAYSKTGYGASFFAVPLYALALNLPGDLGLIHTTLLSSSIVIALTGAILFLAARRLQFARGVSALTALLFGLATPAFVYAKQFWSEPFALAALFAAFYFLQCYRAHTRARDAFFAALALGLAISVRLTNAALVPLYLWYGFENDARAFFFSRGRDVRALRAGAWFGFTLFIFALTILWYNAARYGNPFNSGYRADETFDNPILLGIYGLLFSPGKGLFVYISFLAALVVSVPLLFRRARAEAFLIIALVTFYVLLFSAWYYWWGGTNWGPRFLIPILPFLILMLAPVVELALNVSAREKMQKIFARVFFALCFLAFAIELLGVSIPSLAYRTRLLRLTPTPDMDAIFLPSASPLVGAWQLFKPSALDFGWLRVLDGNVSVDWLIIALTVAFIVICITSLRGVLRFAQDKLDATKQSPSYLEIASHRTLAMTLIAIALAFFSLAHYRDAALDRDAGYRALVQLLARAASAREVLIVNDDARAPFFLNENRARLRWYGLSRDPAQWDDATRALLARLARAYPRIWFAYDDAADAPDPTRAWLDAARIALAQYDFEDGVHLILYAPR